MEAVDQPVARRDGTTNRIRRHAHVGCVKVATILEDIDDLVGFEVRLPRRPGSQQTHHDTGDRGVDTRLVDHQPQQQAEAEEDRRVGDVEPEDDGDDHGDSGGEDEKRRFEVGCVEHSDHDDRPDVVDDRQREQQYLDRCWYA